MYDKTVDKGMSSCKQIGSQSEFVYISRRMHYESYGMHPLKTRYLSFF